MGIRIHQLAKQLGLESRAVVELCGELGLGGKTALSSLTEEEVAKVKAYLKSRSARPTSPVSGGSQLTPAVMQPPKSIKDLGPVRTIPSLLKKTPTADRIKPSSDRPEVVTSESIEVSEVTGGAPVTPTAAEEVRPATSEPVPPPFMPVGGVQLSHTPPIGAEVGVPSESSGPPILVPAGEVSPLGAPAPQLQVDATEVGGGEGMAPPATVTRSATETPLIPPVESAEPSLTPVIPPPGESIDREMPAPESSMPVVPPASTFDAPPAEPPGIVAAVPSAADSPSGMVISPPAAEKRARGDRAEKVDGGDRGATGIIIAPIPQLQKGRQPPKSDQPVLRPEIRLTPEAFKALKTARRPLSEYLKKLHPPEKLAELEKAVEKLAASEELLPAEETPTRPKPKERVKERVAEKEKPREKEREKEKLAPRLPREGAKPKRGAREDADVPAVKELKPSKRKALTPREPSALEAEEEEEPAPTVPITLRRQRKGKGAVTTAPRKTSIVLELPCTVRSFSEAAGVPVHVVLAKLLSLGIMGNINSSLDADVAELLAAEFGLTLEIRAEVDPEEKLRELYDRPDDPAELIPRAPVVTFLGHVDHGKTSLLDRILGTDVVSRERGGITQHIRAYRIFKDGRPITFVDTPGHEAFTAMRARGAQVTDIAVLVVACDDGVMPQTEEAIAHIRAAGVPMVVALNKMDLPGVNPDRVLQQLAGLGVLPSQWGGDVEVVKTSAVTGQGIDELLEVLLTVAELHELKANPNRPAVGVCLEASIQAGRGVVAKLLVKKGTLRVGDLVLCGTAHGRVKAMFDTLDPTKRYEEAGPATPVDVVGLDSPPAAGERFYVLDDIAEARKIAEARAERDRTKELLGIRSHLSLEELSARLAQREQVGVLHLILRADVRGSLEAIQKEMAKLQHPEVKIEVLQAALGAITEGDVELAHASDAIIFGFNVAPTDRALALAEQYGVQIRRYDIIYELTQDIKAALEGLLRPEIREVELGRAVVLKLFPISRVGTVAGCRVVHGVVTRDARIRVVRDGRVIGNYAVQSLRREKDDVREVREGFECGIKLANFDDVKEGDILEAYRLEEIQRRLEVD